MRCEVVAVGTELLLGQIVDTHAPVMARLLAGCGIGCTKRMTVGDNWERLVATLKESLERADVVAEFGLDRVESIFGHRRHDAGGVDDRSG